MATEFSQIIGQLDESKIAGGGMVDFFLVCRWEAV